MTEPLVFKAREPQEAVIASPFGPITADDLRKAMVLFNWWFYNRSNAGSDLQYCGYPILKNPCDLWMYREIIEETRPDFIIECGVCFGGSALYFADVCDSIGHGQVIAIDPFLGELEQLAKYAGHECELPPPAHERITYIKGSSTAPATVAEVKSMISKGSKVMVSLDSDHAAEHVLQELYLYAPLVTPGCYIVVEDTNINGHPVFPDFGPGPFEAVCAFAFSPLAGEFSPDARKTRMGLTYNPFGYLRRSDD